MYTGPVGWNFEYPDSKPKPKIKYRDLNKCGGTLCSWIGRLNIVRCQFSKTDLEVSHNSDKIPARFLVGINKLMLTFVWKGARCRIAKLILKKNKMWGITIWCLDLQ